MAVYAYIDVSQKQEYIYKDSKLSNNLYNSFTIKAITEKLEIDKLKGKNKIIYLSSYVDDDKFIFSGGGNSVIRFNNSEEAKKFVKEYSFDVLKKYPQIELYISLIDDSDISYDTNNREMLILEKLKEKSDYLKDERKSRFKRWTYGIEQLDGNGNPIEFYSKNVESKKFVRKYLFDKFEEQLNGIATITEELKQYKKDEKGKSYIGVISIDGNKMGEMIKKYINSFTELKDFSNLIEEIYFKSIVGAFKEYKKQEETELLLMTPVLQAGDDICLIVEAEHAIGIAHNIIKKIEEISSLRDDLKKYTGSGCLTACAGVAIARYTYPFFELVKIAENMCHEAKEAIYLSEHPETPKSFIQWEIVQSQVDMGIEYENYLMKRNINEKYHIKPLCVKQTNCVVNGIFSYNSFIEIIKKLQEDDENAISSSFLDKLKKNIYNGKDQYEMFIDTNANEKNYLIELFKKGFSNDMDNKNSEYMIYCENSSYTYILNDVLEILPFMWKREK